MTDTSPFNNPDHNCFYFACECCIYVILLLIVSVQEEASNVRCHTSRHHCRQAITTEPQRRTLAFRKPCLQPFATPAIDHNYPKQVRIIILVAFRESIWNMHAHGRYYLASYYNYFEVNMTVA